MLSHLNKLSVVFLAAAGLFLIDGREARAAKGNRYAVFMISNPTKVVSVTYYVKWGNGGWTRYTLAAGQSLCHYWPYRCVNQNRSPIPYIKFETGVAPLGTTVTARGVQTYRLQAYASPKNNANGKPYNFAVLVGNGNYSLDLQKGD
jgi:hypothetical protein